MKSLLFLVLYFALPLTSNASIKEGVGSSGGGFAVVCRSQNHSIYSASFFDRYEGEQSYSLTYAKIAALGDSRAILGELLNRTASKDAFFKKDLEFALNIVKANMVSIPDGSEMVPISDLGNTGPIFIPEGCKLEMLGYFYQGKLYQNQSIMGALSSLDQAAFLAHEAIYVLNRANAPSGNSSNTRALNMHLLSDTYEKFDFDKIRGAFGHTEYDSDIDPNSNYKSAHRVLARHSYQTSEASNAPKIVIEYVNSNNYGTGKLYGKWNCSDRYSRVSSLEGSIELTLNSPLEINPNIPVSECNDLHLDVFSPASKIIKAKVILGNRVLYNKDNNYDAFDFNLRFYQE